MGHCLWGVAFKYSAERMIAIKQQGLGRTFRSLTGEQEIPVIFLSMNQDSFVL